MPSYATDWQDAHSKQSREESCKQEALIEKYTIWKIIKQYEHIIQAIYLII